jgi:hypothetical protein
VLVGLPAAEKLVEAGASGGHESLIAFPAGSSGASSQSSGGARSTAPRGRRGAGTSPSGARGQRRNQVSTKPRTASAAAVRNTRRSAAVIAVTYASWTAGASCFSADGLAAADTVCAGRDGRLEVACEPVGGDGAEDRDADRAADLAEQGRAGCRDAEVLVVDGVLGGRYEHLHHKADPEPEHEHVGTGHHGRGAYLEP